MYSALPPSPMPPSSSSTSIAPLSLAWLPYAVPLPSTSVVGSATLHLMSPSPLAPATPVVPPPPPPSSVSPPSPCLRRLPPPHSPSIVSSTTLYSAFKAPPHCSRATALAILLCHAASHTTVSIILSPVPVPPSTVPAPPRQLRPPLPHPTTSCTCQTLVLIATPSSPGHLMPSPDCDPSYSCHRLLPA